MKMNEVIGFTKVDLPYGWMGNMAAYPLKYENKVWLTSEALFQALRFDDIEILRNKTIDKKLNDKIEESPRKLILRSQLIQKLLSDFKPAHSRNDILIMTKLFFVLFVRCEQKP
jgi:predicted NAD-dependent protein-ADP-ribosyltransferase YbiA (DUF1768 family)